MSNSTTPVYHPSTTLVDLSPSGRVRPWAQHKAEAQIISTALRVAQQDEISDRMDECANWLAFRRSANGSMHLHRANFCRVRICPVCQWRRSMKTASMVRQADTWLQDQRTAKGHKPYRHAMLTLTVPNVPGDQLRTTLSRMSAAWQRLSQRTAVRQAVQGWIRSTEITYNEMANTYHPHMHVLLLVNASYYSSRYYITHADWLKLWQEAMRDNKITQVDIRRATDLSGLVAEIAKYATKPQDIISLTDDLDQMATVASTLLRACHRRRFLGWGGAYKRAYIALGLTDPDEADLVHIDPDAELTDAEIKSWVYTWCPGPRLYML